MKGGKVKKGKVKGGTVILDTLKRKQTNLIKFIRFMIEQALEV